MSILGNFVQNVRASFLTNPPRWFSDLVGGPESDSGMRVGPKTALTYSTVWQAVNVVAGDIAQLPLILYRREPDGDRAQDVTHPARNIFARPNPEWMLGVVFMETLMQHVLLWGNGYAFIERNNVGSPTRLWLLMPDKTWPVIVDEQLWYVNFDDETGEYRRFRPENIFHIKGLGYDGLCGYSVVTMARNSWGLGLSAQKHGNRQFRNTAAPGVILEAPNFVQKEAAEKMLNDWAKMQEGMDNAGRSALLHSGVKASKLGMNNDDAQWLETRAFQRTEVASWFKLPPHKVNDLSRSTFSNIESQERQYVQDSLGTWLVKVQQEADEKMLTERQKQSRSHFWEYNTDVRIRANVQERTEAWKTRVLNGGANVNEWRRAENLPDIGTVGDVYFFPLNMAPLESVATGTTVAEVAKETGEIPQPDEPPDEPPQDRIIQPDLPQLEHKPLDAHRQLIVATMQRRITLESEKAISAAKDMRNFVGWVDKFYESTAERIVDELGLIVSAVSEINGSSCDLEAIARQYAEDSRDGLLTACECEAAVLVASVSACVGNWPNRAERIADLILQNELCEA